MEMRNRLFQMLSARDANRTEFPWFMAGAPPHSKIAVRPIAPEGWWALAAFIAVWVVATVVIWVWGYLSGTFSMAFAIMATILVAGIGIAGFLRLMLSRMTELPPPDRQSR